MRFSILLLAVLVAGCGHTASKETAPPTATTESNPESNMTQVENDARSQSVSNVVYELRIDLDDKNDTFNGKVAVSFDASDTKNLFLDFQDTAKIENFSVNSQPVSSVNFKNHRIALPAQLLKKKNKVEISYVQHYSHEGRGLHRFVDPEDKRVYLYSQFESNDAQRMFPCFDQPDMKAKMRLTVAAPPSWEVISTTRESSKKADGESVIWKFHETPKLSTYLFSLHAGPYQKWESNAGGIPLRLFARRSLAQYVKPENWMTPTKKGLQFYGEYFSYVYPFKKYDEIIVPDFNAGAMENTAAITFSEHFIQRGTVTREDREDLASVILHEMAHVWFGDLVTMQWWNGLWLNESFATFMSSLSQSEATEFKESWVTFFSKEKTWAYWEDQLVTTHPINGDVIDTQSAFVNFDGITYGKGASVLKQLNYYLGPKVFRAGVRAYFRQHAYGNTKLADFIGALEQASHKKLGEWSQAWLSQAGLDSLKPEFTCDAANHITKFTLHLTGPDGKTSPRAHRTQIALYQQSGDELKTYKTVSVEYHGDSTDVPQLLGQACPAMVDPNDQDQDYVKEQLDSKTLEMARSHLGEIKSSFVRTLYWATLFQMVRDAELTPQDFLKTAETNLPGEKDLRVAESVISHLSAVFYYLPHSGSSSRHAHDEWVVKFENILWKLASDATPSSDWQKQSLDAFVSIVESEAGRAHLVELLNGTFAFKGLELDPDQRWAMIVRLSALGDERVTPILAASRKLDQSERGIEMAMAADSAQPSLKVKQTLFNQIAGSKDIPFARERAAARSVLPPWQDSLRASLADNYFESLPQVVRTKDAEVQSLFARAFMPATCSEESAQAIDSFLKQHDGLPPNVVKALKVGHQEDDRCVRVRLKAER